MNRRDFFSSMAGLAALATSASNARSRELATQDAKAPKAGTDKKPIAFEIPQAWRRSGLIIQKSMNGPGSSVVGDPCIVRDDEIDGWRMFLFFSPPGCGHAIRKTYAEAARTNLS